MGNSWMGCLKKITAGKARHETAERQPVPAGQADRPTRVLQPAHTLRLKPVPDEAVLFPATSAESIPRSLHWHGISEKGMVRDHNEDNFAILSFGSKMLFVVADGMGGHDSGEVASRIAMETVCSFVQQESISINDGPSLVERAVQLANKAVRSEGERRGSDMGTTLSMALICEDTAYIANIGDSRAYWIENGSIKQITTDHSLVAKLVELGKISKEEARNHPRSNLLYRTIGNNDIVKADAFRMELKKGGTLLLCTDGLWGEVTDDEIHKACASENDAKAACARLVRMANENGGKDNITAVAVKVV